MKILLGLVLAAVLVAQQPDEPYPGQGNHAQPPAGWYCEHQNVALSVPPAHACSCERMCDDATGKVIEDKQCTVWCHGDSCKCDMSNKQACK